MKRPIVLAGLMLFTPLASGSGFDFAALQSLITINHIRSIEAVLPALPDSLRYRYALVFASRSLQDAGYDGPRVILFGPDARLVVTFNGDRDQRGYDALETMEFDAASGQFRFREVQFPTHPADASPVTFSEPNPSRCQRCHGTPARPVWDTQPLWPGAYGERYQASLSAEEQAGMASFLARQAADPRYQSLLGVDRFANPETFRPSARNRYAGTPPEPPNAELSARLESLVARSIVVELTVNPRFAVYQFLLLGVSEGNCGSLEDFYPAEWSRDVRAAYSAYVTATSEEGAREAEAKQLRLTPGNRRLATLAALHPSATRDMLRFIAESAMNIPTRSWTLALEKGTQDLAQSSSARGFLRDALLAEVARRDSRIREFSDYATSADGDRYCSYLKRRSRAALVRVPARGAAPGTVADQTRVHVDGSVSIAAAGREPPQPAILRVCADCHQSNVAPAIPFAHPEQLARELLSRPTSHGHLIDEIHFRLGPDAGAKKMPLGLNLSVAERLELESYFDALAAQSK